MSEKKAQMEAVYTHMWDSHEGRASRELMRLARMLRKQEHYQEILGARRYEVALANYHWAIYILLGKLSPTLYVLRKKTGDTR